jgi:hypothetical protein
MKTIIAVLMVMSFAFLRASAQVVTLDVSLDQDQFLPAERLPVTIHLYNSSGQSLHLGDDNQWLTFSVQSLDNNNAIVGSQPSVTGGFDLGSSDVAIKHVDIEPYFNLKQTGRYSVTASVHIPQWNMDVSSTPKEFDIIEGAELWSKDFGVPVPAGVSNQPPEIRKYVLQEANYLQKQLRLYLEVTDQTGEHVFKASAIGPMVSFSHPEAQLDGNSNLHVLYQDGGQSFLYSIINPDGNILQQDIYDYVNSRPHLTLDDSGNIVVAGGVKRVKPEEIPLPIPPASPPPDKQ